MVRVRKGPSRERKGLAYSVVSGVTGDSLLQREKVQRGKTVSGEGEVIRWQIKGAEGELGLFLVRRGGRREASREPRGKKCYPHIGRNSFGNLCEGIWVRGVRSHAGRFLTLLESVTGRFGRGGGRGCWGLTGGLPRGVLERGSSVVLRLLKVQAHAVRQGSPVGEHGLKAGPFGEEGDSSRGVQAKRAASAGPNQSFLKMKAEALGSNERGEGNPRVVGGISGRTLGERRGERPRRRRGGRQRPSGSLAGAPPNQKEGLHYSNRDNKTEHSCSAGPSFSFSPTRRLCGPWSLARISVISNRQVVEEKKSAWGDHEGGERAEILKVQVELNGREEEADNVHPVSSKVKQEKIKVAYQII